MALGHGGARSGSGRKPKPYDLRKIPKSLSMERYLVDWLNKNYGRGASRYVNDLLAKAYAKKEGVKAGEVVKQ